MNQYTVDTPGSGSEYSIQEHRKKTLKKFNSEIKYLCFPSRKYVYFPGSNAFTADLQPDPHNRQQLTGARARHTDDLLSSHAQCASLSLIPNSGQVQLLRLLLRLQYHRRPQIKPVTLNIN